jgi:PAS domain S-box-containing protein
MQDSRHSDDSDSALHPIALLAPDPLSRRTVTSSNPTHDDHAASRLAVIVESADDAILSVDLQGLIQSWNTAATKMLGYTAAEALGQSVVRLLPLDRQRADEKESILQRVRRWNTVERIDSVWRRKDGLALSVSLIVAPIRADDGKLFGLSVIARDITDRDRTERAARRLAAIVESSDDAIASKDLNGIVTSWNRAAERMFGYSAEEMVGESIRRIIPADRQAEEDEVLRQIRRGSKVDHFETVRRRKDGTLFPVSLTVSPVRGADGTIIGASKIARDITESKQAELERTRLLKAAQDASRVKDEFLATLSHELRTPLNAILGYARMIRSGLIADGHEGRAIETIERNATSLSQIVEDVLDVSRIVAGRMRLNVQPVDLPEVVRSALDAVRPAADARGVRLETVLDPQASPISGDPDRLQQVIWNLVSNAVKFTPRGGRAQVRLERVHSHMEVIVSDTGVGVAQDFLPHIFEPFRQADSGTTRERGGLGLGLAIARQLVEMHGGTIHAASGGTGTGATFRVKLPLMIVHPEAYEGPRLHPRSERARPPIAVPDLSGVRVIAVDDDRDALRLVREILEAAHADVLIADSAEHALALLERVSADVLVADLGMPHMDGFELIARVRRATTPQVRDIPAAALTAYARSEDRTKALRAGFHLHLAKPIDPGELMAAVASLAKRIDAGDTR